MLKEDTPQKEATIRALFLHSIASGLEASGIASASLFRQHGFQSAMLSKPYEKISLRRYVSFTEYLADRIKRPYFLFELGRRFDLVDLGPLCTLFVSSTTLRSAIDYFIRSFCAWQTNTTLEASLQGDVTIYSYAIEDPTIWPRRQDAEFFMAWITSLIRSLTSESWNPVEIGFEHSISGRQAALQSHLRCQLSGCCRTNFIVVRNEELDRRRRTLDDTSTRTLRRVEEDLNELLEPTDSEDKTLVESIGALIARRLGRSSIGIREIASELEMSERTLRRRLFEMGTSYREILEEKRILRARQLLATRSISLVALADLLGYSDAAVFSRAFKKWSGTPPRTYHRCRELASDAVQMQRDQRGTVVPSRRDRIAPAALNPLIENLPIGLEVELDRLRRELAELRIERDHLRQVAEDFPHATP